MYTLSLSTKVYDSKEEYNVSLLETVFNRKDNLEAHWNHNNLEAHWNHVIYMWLNYQFFTKVTDGEHS